MYWWLCLNARSMSNNRILAIICCIKMLCSFLVINSKALVLQEGKRYLRMSTSSYPNFHFDIQKTSDLSKARVGVIQTPHGIINTPNFVFCATKASLKGVSPAQLRDENTEIILSNTYHLMLAPGSEVIEKMGGLQKFTGSFYLLVWGIALIVSGWHGPMLTDSGGYQIFSMGFGSVSNEIKGKRNLTNVPQVYPLFIRRCFDTILWTRLWLVSMKMRPRFDHMSTAASTASRPRDPSRYKDNLVPI